MILTDLKINNKKCIQNAFKQLKCNDYAIACNCGESQNANEIPTARRNMCICAWVILIGLITSLFNRVLDISVVCVFLPFG